MKRILATVATATLALGGLVATATAAAAHTPDVDAVCGSLSINLTQYADSRDGRDNTVTVVVDGGEILRESFGREFRTKLELTEDEAHQWTVSIDAWDDDAWDWNMSGDLAACVEPGPEPTPEVEPELETAFYVYPKLDPTKIAAWENSGEQTLIATREGDQFWDELPQEYPGELFDVTALPADVCEGSWGVQQDVVRVDADFSWDDFQHITYPDGPLFGWRLKDHRHDDLSNYLAECGEEAPEPVAVPSPSFVESCDAGITVTMPDTGFATYSEEWSADRTQVTVTATLAEGVEVAPETALSWTYTLTGEACASEPVVVTPDAPKVIDECGTEADELRLPGAVEGLTYSSSAEGIVATASAGYTLGELPAGYTAIDESTAVYAVDESVFTDEPCATTPAEEPTEEPTQDTTEDRPAAQDVAVDVPADAGEDEEVAVAAQTTELPRTGATVGITAGVAALLVAAGATLFVVRRRVAQR
ncbi:LPXTG-motif cell wall-anchored protein [Isoptericola jiangsuensis]|uniref:LPXTG-motif cell wall-anchored protein n=1 Tax=Isoptericola jiangsuensis TaxID=548579 RepID=A0A2A9EZW0_9MICO|nr:LPXTG cell wall anchor domain-containing protein [Isoptericola jiangsuensis]PFG44584.1 LPXTG-motif cell wall-anchored protein [Isoptericola jiangsuensis]